MGYVLSPYFYFPSVDIGFPCKQNDVSENK